MKRMKRSWILLAALAMVIASCGGDAETTTTGDSGPAQTTTTTVPTDTTPDEPPANTEPIRIGVSVSLSGFNAAVGEEYLRGLELWADMINNSTGIYEGRQEPGLLGRRVELVFSNDESVSENALRIYERLMTQENVDFVFGPFGSGATGTVAPIIEREQYALIATSASADSIYQQGLEYIVQGVAPASQYLGRVPEIMEDQGYTTVALLSLNNPFTLSSVDFLRPEIESRGGEIVSEHLFEITEVEFTATLTEVKSAAPDVIIIQAFGNQAVTIYNQMAELDVSAPMMVMSAGAWRDDVFLAGVGPERAECLLADHHWAPTDGTPGNAEFAAGYTDRFGSVATVGSDPSPAMGFSAGQLLTYAVDGVGEAGLTDQKLLIDYLRNTPDLQTVLGAMSADPATGGNTSITPRLIQFQGGIRVVVAPPEGELSLPCAPLGDRPSGG